MATILTFNQYVKEIHTKAREKYNLTWEEVKTELPQANYLAEWRDYVVKSYNDGGTIPTRLWNELDEGLLYRVKRTHRYLSA